jgi:uncharacterized protein
MKARSPDPRRLDMAAAATDALALEGRWPLAGFDRLIEGAAHDGDVAWSARGQSRRVASGEPEIWLHLAAQARVWRDCQRCLQPVALDLEVARAFRFVADEATAEALDAESEDDVLALPRSLDLHELVEDELLLTLPVVPMHNRCPVKLPMSAGADAGEPEPAPKPFASLAGLAGLKRGGKL